MSKLYVYRAILVVLTAANLLCAVVLAPATLMASFMMFDTPGGEQRWWMWALLIFFFFVSLSIPLWFVAGAVLGWMLHLRRGWMVGSLLVAAAPLVAFPLLFIFIDAFE